MFIRTEDQARYQELLSVAAAMISKTDYMNLTDKTMIGRHIVQIAIGMVCAEIETAAFNKYSGMIKHVSPEI